MAKCGFSHLVFKSAVVSGSFRWPKLQRFWNALITLFALQLTIHRRVRFHYRCDSYGAVHGAVCVEPRNSLQNENIDIPHDQSASSSKFVGGGGVCDHQYPPNQRPSKSLSGWYYYQLWGGAKA